jgi:hypothetical protein
VLPFTHCLVSALLLRSLEVARLLNYIRRTVPGPGLRVTFTCGAYDAPCFLVTCFKFWSKFKMVTAGAMSSTCGFYGSCYSPCVVRGGWRVDYVYLLCMNLCPNAYRRCVKTDKCCWSKFVCPCQTCYFKPGTARPGSLQGLGWNDCYPHRMACSTFGNIDTFPSESAIAEYLTIRNQPVRQQ